LPRYVGEAATEDRNADNCSGAHTATVGLSPARCHSSTRRFVHTTANGLRGANARSTRPAWGLLYLRAAGLFRRFSLEDVGDSARCTALPGGTDGKDRASPDPVPSPS
jgi:hypothetical protein